MVRFTALLAAVLLLPSVAHAQLENVVYDWQNGRNKDGIVISTSRVEGSPHKAVRGEMLVKGSVASLFALVEDMGACPKWASFCKESRVEERISKFETYVYVYNDVPFPITDRDVYAHVVWTQDPESKRLSMTSRASKGGTPRTKAVRIQEAVLQWHFTPVGDGLTKVENFGHVNPNGPTPAWISNMLLIDSPFNSMQNMREIIESGEYADAVLEIENL